MVTRKARYHLFINRRHSPYPAGYFALGVAYLLGDDVEKDDAKAKDYLLLALDNNVIWAAKALSALHENKASEFYDVERAETIAPCFKTNGFKRHSNN